MSRTASREALPRFGDRLRLGRAGLRVSPFCIGHVDSPAVVGAAFDRGINFFFLTADMHWPKYESLRKGLRQLVGRDRRIRDQIVVGVVCYPTQPEFCSVPFEEVLEAAPELQRIDVLIAGGVYAADFKQRLPVYQAHRARKFSGARAIGATFHERATALWAVNNGAVDVAFVRYNPEHPGAREDIFPKLNSHKRSVLFGFKSTQGFRTAPDLSSLGANPRVYWQPGATDYYRFALSRPELDGILCALGSVAELRALESALSEGPLSSAEEKFLINLALLSAGRTA